VIALATVTRAAAASAAAAEQSGITWTTTTVGSDDRRSTPAPMKYFRQTTLAAASVGRSPRRGTGHRPALPGVRDHNTIGRAVSSHRATT